MDRRQLGFTVTAVVLALVLGAGVALLATSGGDEDRATEDPEPRSTTTSSSPSTTTTTTLIPRPAVTVPTSPPPTVRVVPPPTDAPTTTTTKAKKPRRKRAPKATATTTVAPAAVPQAAPSTQPAAPPTTTTSTSTTTSTTTTTTTTSSTTTTTLPAPPTETGVSADEIRLTVLADDVRTLDGASAWANAVNRSDGLAGREVRLDLVVTDGTAETFDRAVDAACEHSFAIVASHAGATGDEGVALQRCGIPDVPVETSSPAHAANPTTFAAFPRQPRTEPVGPYRWLQDELDECCSQFVLVPADGPDRTDTEAAIDAAAQIGFGTAATPDVALDAPATDYDALAQELASSGATFAASGLGADSTLELRRAASTAGVARVLAWYCDARCYDASVSADSGADGQYVGIETVPFGDRRDVPELRAYLRAAGRIARPSSYEGLRAYVAGVLFEQAVADVVADHGSDGLTRARLVASLGSIHDFTGRGLVGTTDVGARAPNGCFVLLQVDAGRFTRVAPGGRGSLDCGSQNLVQLDG